MKKLSLKNRLSPTLVGMFAACLGVVAAPSLARADVKESWETGVDATKWISTTGNNAYVTPGLALTIADDGPAAACAGKYLRETVQVSGGRVYSQGANGVQAVTAGQRYCVSAWIRGSATAPQAQPYLGINYSNAAGVPVLVGGGVGDGECYIAGGTGGDTSPRCTGLTSAPVVVDGTWRWYARDFVAAPPATGTHIVAKVVNFCGDGNCGNPVGALSPADFDDIRITPGACTATPPADTAPHVACTGTTPICTLGDAANNAKCMDCTGNSGAAAPARACPVATPVCVTAGATKGSCKVSCTGDFGTAGAAACAEATPFCVDIAGSTFKECKPCAGNNGSATLPACPAANPTCFTAGAKVGTCGKCTAQADCGGATPRCDIGTGRCTDDCEADADCGDKKSGKICLASTLKCTDGCRGDAAGNGCPDGSKCSSVDLKPGTCTPTAPPDAGPGKPDAGPTPTPDAGPTPEVDSGTTPPAPPAETPAVEEAGGCAMSPSSAGGTATMFVGFGLAVAALGRRRRRN